MPPRARGKHPLTHAEIKEQLDYDPVTGVLTWRVSKPRIRKGQRAGNVGIKGHRQITICGFSFSEHRLIWWWMTGEDPGERYVDHKNRRRGDNRWKNLRLSTHGQNCVNSTKFGSMRGIVKRGRGYRVRIGGGAARRCARVGSLRDAKRLRREWEREIYGEFACSRR